MAFCGQCGYLLTRTMSKCPRCGVPVQDTDIEEEPHPDDPTMLSLDQSLSRRAGHYAVPPENQQSNPAGMPGQGYTYRPQTQTPTNSYNAPTQTSTPPQPAGSLSQSPTHSSPDDVSDYPAPSYPDSVIASHTEIPQGGPHRKRGYYTIALVTLTILLLAAAAAAYLVIGPDRLLGRQGDNTNTPIPTTASTPTPTATPTPEQQAQAIVQQYYDEINNKNYRSAYNLWVDNPQSYEDFAKGFEHTQRDEITFSDIVSQNDGTVKVNITLTATEDAGEGAQQKVYQGYYIVGQQPDYSWKIITANLTPATG